MFRRETGRTSGFPASGGAPALVLIEGDGEAAQRLDLTAGQYGKMEHVARLQHVGAAGGMARRGRGRNDDITALAARLNASMAVDPASELAVPFHGRLSAEVE